MEKAAQQHRGLVMPAPNDKNSTMPKPDVAEDIWKDLGRNVAKMLQGATTMEQVQNLNLAAVWQQQLETSIQQVVQRNAQLEMERKQKQTEDDLRNSAANIKVEPNDEADRHQQQHGVVNIQAIDDDDDEDFQDWNTADEELAARNRQERKAKSQTKASDLSESAEDQSRCRSRSPTPAAAKIRREDNDDDVSKGASQATSVASNP